jgi:hypothetical protein
MKPFTCLGNIWIENWPWNSTMAKKLMPTINFNHAKNNQ